MVLVTLELSNLAGSCSGRLDSGVASTLAKS